MGKFYRNKWSFLFCCFFLSGTILLGQPNPASPTVGLEVARFENQESGIFRFTIEDSTLLEVSEIETTRGKENNVFAVFADPYSSKSDFLGRFQKTEAITLYFRLKGGQIQKLEHSLKEAKESIDPKMLEKAWARALLSDYVSKANRHQSSFYQYAAMVTAKRYGLEKELRKLDQKANVFNNPFRTTPDLYSVFTGAAAIQETLQLDMMRQIRHKKEKYTLAARELKGPTIEAHPFAEMVAGKEYQRFFLSQYAPHDFYYLHATSINNFLSIFDRFKEWGKHLGRHYMTMGRDILLKEKYQTQLALKVNPFMRPFYALAIERVAVMGSDLYLSEGSDLTLVFQLKQPPLFQEKIEGYRKSFQAEYQNSKRDVFEYQGMTIDVLATPHRRISSYLVYPEENIAILSNSLTALKKILATKTGKELSLYNTEEFKYIRSVFKGNTEEESAFIYLSDPFIRNLVGPKSKILEQRRVRVVNTFQMMQNAALLHLLEKGQLALSLEELVAQKYIEKEYLECPFGGKYSLENGMTPVSSVLGTRNQMTPLLELEFETISAREKKEYRRFLLDYNNYWREFFDPIGIRIFQNGKGIKVETVILPLINNSLYQNLSRMIGGEGVTLNSGKIPPKTILLTRIKLPNLLQRMQRQGQLDFLLNQMSAGDLKEGDQFINLFGESASVGLLDHEMIFGFNVSGEIAQSLRRGGRMNKDLMLIAPLVASLNLPLFASFSLEKPEKLKELLENLAENHIRKMATRAASSFGFVKIDPYRMKTTSGVSYGVLRFTLFNSLTIRLYYGIEGKTLYLSSNRETLEKILTLTTEEEKNIFPTVSANFQLDLAPQNYHHVLEEFELAWSESSREACLKNTDALQMYADLFGKTGGKIELLAKELEEVFYYCPAGGYYALSSEGFAECSQHHYRFAPEQSSKMDNVSPLQLASRVSITLRFIPEGLYTCVEIRDKIGD